MSASPVNAFTTLMGSVNVPFLTGANEFVNDVAAECYIANAFMMGRGKEEQIQSGPKIKDRIFLEGEETFFDYRPGQVWNFDNPQTHDTWETEWAHSGDYMSWTEEELLKSAPDGMTKAAKMSALKDVKAQKEQRLIQSIADGMDKRLWAIPDFATMEDRTSSDNRSVMSIPALINEETNGLHTQAETGTWTTKQGIDPVVKEKFRPGQFTYNYDSYTNDDDGLIASINKAVRRLEFKPPTKFQQHFTKETKLNMKLIVTGNDGYDLAEAALRNKGETFYTKARNDTDYGGILLGGIELQRYAPLDDKRLYDDGSGNLVTQANASKNGPRYYMFDLQHINLFFHKQKYLERRTPREPSNQPEYWVQPVVCWWNLVVSSLRRHGIVSPVA